MAQHENNSHFLAGKKAYDQKNYEKAIGHFDRALDVLPQNAYIHYERAMCYYHLKKLSMALLDLDNAIKGQPDNPFRYASRAFMRSAAKDINGAISDYEKAIDLDPEDAISFNNLGLLQEKLGYMKQAKSNFSTADQLAEQNGFVPFDKAQEDQKQVQEQAQETTATIELPKPGEVLIEDEPTTLWKEVAKVFTSKESLKEFLTFVQSGFKKS